METEDLIRSLAADTKPVRPLRPPWVRVGVWLALAAPYVIAVVFMMSLRRDLPDKLSDMRFVLEQTAALATALAAALAAFELTIPGRSPRIALLPLAPFAVWLGTLGQGCLNAWFRFGPEGLSLRPDWACLPGIVLVGAIPGVVMVAMLRHGAPLHPHLATALGALAAAALANFGLRLFHYQDASMMVLVWQLGTVAVLSALAGLVGNRVLDWRRVRAHALRRSAGQ